MILLLLLAPLILVLAYQVSVSTYLAVLAAASFLYRPRLSQLSTGHRIAVLVPAHNEEALIGRLLASLGAVDYPPDLFDVYVVADNCIDATANIARRNGAIVFERFDADSRGKGHALRFLMRQVDLDAYDAVFVVDADAVVSTNVLKAVSGGLDRDWSLIQVYDGVYNRDSSPAAELRALAFDMHNRVRPMGQEVLGASVGLMGNGMAISSSLFHGALWDSFGLAEDMEAHARLVADGQRVHYIDNAYALAEMPSSLQESEGQNERWEAGRLDVARRHAPKLFASAVGHRSWTRFLAAVDLLVPPQSAQVAMAIAAFALAVLSASNILVAMAVYVLAAEGLYILLGLIRLRRGVSPRLLAHLPRYLLWKGVLYLRLLAGRRPKVWVRAHRATDRATTNVR
jgi:cellulose synthase/poly-beta-1,6-N-acetylglucosamine synthase-like glycosyltransferase